MIIRSVTVRAGITRSAKFQSVTLEVIEQVDLEPGDDQDEAIISIRRRLFQEIDEPSMRGVVYVANQEIK